MDSANCQWEKKWRQVLVTDAESFLCPDLVARGVLERLSVLDPAESVVPWASICYRGRTDLVLMEGCLNSLFCQEQLLEEAFHHMVADLGSNNNALLCEELAPPHRDKSTRAAQRGLGFDVLPWASQSTELSPTEDA